MSSKRSSSSSKRSSSRAIENNEDFSIKLGELLSTNTNRKKKRNAAKLLDETCSHIRKLNGEVEELSNRISELMASNSDTNNSINPNIIRQFLQQ